MANYTAEELATKTQAELKIILSENVAELKELGETINTQVEYRREIIAALTNLDKRKNKNPPE